MGITKIKKADIVAAVPDSWAKQYHESYWDDDESKAEIKRKLFALRSSNDLTAENVEQAIGNTSWTECSCDVCEDDFEVVVRIGEEQDYDARWVDICKSCLEKALATIED